MATMAETFDAGIKDMLVVAKTTFSSATILGPRIPAGSVFLDRTITFPDGSVSVLPIKPESLLRVVVERTEPDPATTEIVIEG